MASRKTITYTVSFPNPTELAYTVSFPNPTELAYTVSFPNPTELAYINGKVTTKIVNMI